MMVKMVDPPEGWRYGFPKPLRVGFTTKELVDLLRDSGYPEEDIELALGYSRYWEEDV